MNQYEGVPDGQGCLLGFLFFGLTGIILYLAVPSWATELTLAAGGGLILAGFRWLFVSIMNWIYRDSTDEKYH